MSASLSFNPTCPACELNPGVPKIVGFTGDERTITYQCASCGHRWTATDHVHRVIALYPYPSIPPPGSRSISG